MIVESGKNEKNPDIKALTELTGVRKITRLADGKGDETAYFLSDEYVLLVGFTSSLRLLELDSGKIRFTSKPALPIMDKRGIIAPDSRCFFYAKPESKTYSIFEYDLTSHKSTPLCNLPKADFRCRYDGTSGILQFQDKNDNIIVSFDLKKKTKVNYGYSIKSRPARIKTLIPCRTGYENITLTVEGKEVSIGYPRVEFLNGFDPENFYMLEDTNTVLMESRWYPGLYILVDIDRKTAWKVYLPPWLIPEDHYTWQIISGKLYIWLGSGDKAGMYLVDPKLFQNPTEFFNLISDYKLYISKSGVSVTVPV